jgi:hypothetical protein
MIASNFRRYPEAMALQLVLAFGRCTWHTTRPTTRLGRALRAERSRLVKVTPQIVRWVAKTVPVWWRLAKKAARALAKAVAAALMPLVWDQGEPTPTKPKRRKGSEWVQPELPALSAAKPEDFVNKRVRATSLEGAVGSVYFVARGGCWVVFEDRATGDRIMSPEDLDLWPETNNDLQEHVDGLPGLYAAAERFMDEHEDSFRKNHFTTRVERPNWAPSWHHYGVGHGSLIPDDYRA